MDEREREQQALDTAGLAEGTERREIVERLVLHEERAEVEVLRDLTGAVQIRRVVTERQEVVPVTLTNEHLEITVTDGVGRVRMNGEVLEPGRVYTVELSEERAEVRKQVFPLQEVTIAKQRQTFTHSEQITLRREELDVQGLEGEVRELDSTRTDNL
ncbi:hypothetical protein Dcar01_03629 [Deinococcus carri]|uniref:DUF2382 domain-containing protein n=1 Tax=Deinococcus carri TaxID=1211323 RepID=A0ABP9WCW6_9DEIO